MSIAVHSCSHRRNINSIFSPVHVIAGGFDDAAIYQESWKMKCILHVGPPKTGSTTIQTFLRQNKEILLTKGILALVDNQLQRKLPFYFKKNPRLTPWAKKIQLDQPQKIEALRADTHQYLCRQIKKYQPDLLVLSSEGLARMVTTDMDDMRNYLQGIASEIEIVFFLRRPDFRILSGYKNKLRNRLNTEDISARYTRKYDDGKTIRQLGNYFGTDAITPIISMDSHPCKAEAKGHIEALLEVLLRGSDVTLRDFIIPDRRNIAWDYKALCYMREFNKLSEKNPEFEKHRQLLAKLLQQHFSGGEKIKISRSVAQDIVANYQAGIEDIRQEYFPDRETLFHTDFSMYDENTSLQNFGPEEAVFVSMVLLEKLLKGSEVNTG